MPYLGNKLSPNYYSSSDNGSYCGAIGLFVVLDGVPLALMADDCIVEPVLCVSGSATEPVVPIDGVD